MFLRIYFKFHSSATKNSNVTVISNATVRKLHLCLIQGSPTKSGPRSHLIRPGKPFHPAAKTFC